MILNYLNVRYNIRNLYKLRHLLLMIPPEYPVLGINVLVFDCKNTIF
ncbi:hypothetical protein HMPREF9136_1339 [Prevotella dentalis DSM 3688]|uniref:Uncharacterized protein n=1 Tax=Prevotella dentalis (strain ATCC 49559 / DSM 3688 / JCM 13448 / NCTC 12043 / ES 2772) TaxID=908937 RepID=F9D3B1_PREDD|nr:hypothetical protein HMPREF9136_1339 [Prevotella dentalis DSM 3688]